MKYFLIILILFSLGCKMSQPVIDEDYKGMSEIEKKMQFEYDMCVYAQQYSENVDLRCDNIKQRNSKVNMILLYNVLEKEEQLPIIYRSKGNEPMTFDDFFKYAK